MEQQVLKSCDVSDVSLLALRGCQVYFVQLIISEVIVEKYLRGFYSLGMKMFINAGQII